MEGVTNCMRIKQSLNSSDKVPNINSNLSVKKYHNFSLDFMYSNYSRRKSSVNFVKNLWVSFWLVASLAWKTMFKGERRRWVLCRPREEEYEMRMR